MFTNEDVYLEMIDVCNEKLLSIDKQVDFIDYFYYSKMKEYCEECLKKGE